MVIDSENINGVVVIKVSGTLSVENLSQLEKTLADVIKKRLNSILDFSTLNFIDSSSLGIIVMYYARFTAAGKFLCISNLNNNIFQMFSLTGIGKRVPIYDTVDEALEHISDNINSID